MMVNKTTAKTEHEEIGEELHVLSEPSYVVIKKLVHKGLPTIGSLYFIGDLITGLPATEVIIGVTAIVTLIFGMALDISSSRYNESDVAYDGQLLIKEDPGGVAGFTLELDGDPELLADKSTISFKVRRERI